MRETKGLARHHREASGAGMRRHTRKAWSGGKPPEINAEGKAALAHVEQCAKCKTETLPMTTCEEGKRLFALFNASVQ